MSEKAGTSSSGSRALRAGATAAAGVAASIAAAILFGAELLDLVADNPFVSLAVFGAVAAFCCRLAWRQGAT